MRESEAIAKSIIEYLQPSTKVEFIENQSNGTHDFNLIYLNDIRIPLEVTESRNKIMTETGKIIRTNSIKIPIKHCRQGWYVVPGPYANIKKIKESVDTYLAQIESEGVQRFFAFTDAVHYKSIEKILSQLRIHHGYTLRGAHILIGPPNGGAITIDAEHVELAISSEAFKNDIRNKLGKCNSSQRHLFVLIDESNYAAYASINATNPPIKKPLLPLEITHVWAAASTRDAKNYIVGKAPKKRIGPLQVQFLRFRKS